MSIRLTVVGHTDERRVHGGACDPTSDVADVEYEDGSTSSDRRRVHRRVLHSRSPWWRIRRASSSTLKQNFKKLEKQIRVRDRTSDLEYADVGYADAEYTDVGYTDVEYADVE